MTQKNHSLLYQYLKTQFAVIRISIHIIHLKQNTYFSFCTAQSSTLSHQIPEMLEINMNGEQLLLLQNCRQNFPWHCEAYMWQCQSQYINSCARAVWCNPDLWLRLKCKTHGISKAHILTDMLHPTGSVKIQWCSLSLCMCRSKPRLRLLPEAEERLQTSLCL